MLRFEALRQQRKHGEISKAVCLFVLLEQQALVCVVVEALQHERKHGEISLAVCFFCFVTATGACLCCC